MRKIYSLVLMTAMLFIGANVNATVRPVSDGTGLASAWAEAASGDTIRLTQTITHNACLTLDDGRSLVLDLNNQVLESTPAAQLHVFFLKHGKLKVIGRGEIRNATTATSKYKYSGSYMHVFYVQGSTNFADSAYTVLEVAKGTVLKAMQAKNCVDIDQNGSSHSAYGVRVYLNCRCEGNRYGVQLSGNVSRAPKGGTNDPTNALDLHYQYPYIHIMDSAVVTAASDASDAVGAYSGGYGIWLIEGKVQGSTGVYVKGGNITINNATIESTNEHGKGIQESETAGVNGGGNAIATESNGGYAGAISVTISGDTHVSTASDSAYAICDTTTTATTSQVTSITITGGTIEGGTNAGAVKIDEQTGSVVTVDGGTFTGDVSSLISHTSDGGTSIIQDVVSTDENGNATVIIGKPEEGSTVPSISPTAQDTIDFDFSSVDETSIVTLKASATTGNLSYTLSGVGTTTEMQYLSLKAVASKTITVTVAAGHTVKVGQIVMDDNAQIVVEAGAKLLVTNSNGIFANNVENLIINANNNTTDRATFVISPDVTTNKQPKATVKYYTEACGATTSNVIWQRMTSPLSTFGTIASNASTLSPTLVPGASVFKTWIEYYSEEESKWKAISANQIKAYTSYALTNNSLNGGITYTLTGNVQGNVANNIELNTNGWNYMGNPFIAPMHVKTLLNTLLNKSKNPNSIDGSIYLWDLDKQKYIGQNSLIIAMTGGSISEIPALHTFIVHMASDYAVLDIDYENTVYNYVINPSSYAAAPERIGDVNAVRIQIQSANGESDELYLVEGENYTAGFENGADMVKYMNNGINFYVADNENYTVLATNDINGTMLSLQTVDEIEYTLSFDNVRGEVYALRDNLTNTIVLMNEGATYNFTAQPNATLEGRFQIVSRQEMPTAVETIEETVAPKAIYTVMGQYVGETTDWNNLPAGVYVVDGVKVIK